MAARVTAPKTFDQVFEAARYTQARDGENLIALSPFAHSLGLDQEYVEDMCLHEGASMVGLTLLDGEVALYIKAQ